MLEAGGGGGGVEEEESAILRRENEGEKGSRVEVLEIEKVVVVGLVEKRREEAIERDLLRGMQFESSLRNERAQPDSRNEGGLVASTTVRHFPFQDAVNVIWIQQIHRWRTSYNNSRRNKSGWGGVVRGRWVMQRGGEGARETLRNETRTERRKLSSFPSQQQRLWRRERPSPSGRAD